MLRNLQSLVVNGQKRDLSNLIKRKLKEFAKHYDQNLIGEIRKYSKYSEINKNRKSEDLVLLLEGKILVKEAIKSKSIRINRIFWTNKDPNIANELLESGISSDKITQIDNKLMNLISDVKTNQGLAAFVSYKKSQLHVANNRLSLTVILDRVKDPGNMGTIIRTAAGIGCESLVVTKESADPWSPKVLRSAMGAHFRIRIVDRVDRDELAKLTAGKLMIFADSKSDKKSISYTRLEERLANTDRGVCLVMGNETKGISEELYRLFAAKPGLRVRIPVEMESLNCSVAFGVLGFEIRRILMKK